MSKSALVEQLESSIEFLKHRLNVEASETERQKLAKELSQAKGQLTAARMRANA